MPLVRTFLTSSVTKCLICCFMYVNHSQKKRLAFFFPIQCNNRTLSCCWLITCLEWPNASKLARQFCCPPSLSCSVASIVTFPSTMWGVCVCVCVGAFWWTGMYWSFQRFVTLSNVATGFSGGAGWLDLVQNNLYGNAVLVNYGKLFWGGYHPFKLRIWM